MITPSWKSSRKPTESSTGWADKSNPQTKTNSQIAGQLLQLIQFWIDPFNAVNQRFELPFIKPGLFILPLKKWILFRQRRIAAVLQQ